MAKELRSQVAVPVATQMEESKEHLEVVTGKKTISVTKLLDRCFPPFEPKAVIDRMMSADNWSQSRYYDYSSEEILMLWEQSKLEGTRLHRNIDHYFKTKQAVEQSPEFIQFLDFDRTRPRVAVLSEHRVTHYEQFAEHEGIVGVIDYVEVMSDGSLVLFDWKRKAEKEFRLSNPYENGIGCCSDLPNSSFYRFAMQLSNYAYLFEQQGKKVEELNIVLLHPENKRPFLFPVPYLKPRVKQLWSELK